MKRRKKNSKKKFALSLTILILFAFGIGIPLRKSIISKSNLNKSSTAYASSRYKADNIKNNPSQNTIDPNKNTKEKNNGTSSSTSTNVVNNSNISNKDFFSKAVFLGDSITEGMSFYEVLDQSHVVAKKGLTVFKAEKYINDITNLAPKNIFILLGNNDLFEETLTSKQFINEYNKLVGTLKTTLPNSKIYILSILPVTAKAEKENPFLANTRINEFNDTLKNMSKEQNLTYINVASVLNNSEKLYEPDGIHFKYDFYNLLLTYLKNYILNNKN